jgi:hypothetical protein
MDLFDEKTLTAEQRFVLMLNDKLDKVIDELNSLKIEYNEYKIRTDSVIPKEHKLMKCPDKNMYANTAFIRIHLKDKEGEKEFLEYIKTLDLETDNFYIDLTKDLLVKSEHDNSRENCWAYLWTAKNIKEDNITVQGIIQFKNTKLISDVGNSICNKLINDIIVHNGGPYGGGLYIEPLENGRSMYVQLYYLYYINAGNQKKKIRYVSCDSEDLIGNNEILEFDKWDSVDMDWDDTPSMRDVQVKLEECWFINDIIYNKNTYLGVSNDEHHHPLLKSMAEIEYQNE